MKTNKHLNLELEHTKLLLQEAFKREEYLEAENRELRRTRLKDFNNEEYWIFLDDGEDYIESLVCPITMSASKLRELVNYRNQEKEHLHLFLQWFNSLEDINYSFLTDADFKVAKATYEKLGKDIPKSIIKRLKIEQ
ncbi:MAG: hypothetical protein GOVbin8609_62 [Prokaryotic dsDNA virus sp.]|mgnify:CR=1 FL=1|nr:MAG: hypothetical protein GOVbin8609_62 [Prokaryotic dsDNA virus sp.]|tara:strand:- start:12139 stop:12549 length:411 start_codon:yes stop_codon:yes gene_type:complete